MSAEELSLNQEEPKCLKCGGFLDTGWECNDCGWDGIDWYFPEHKAAMKPSTQEQP